jgi:hypothetical protein
MPDKPAVNLDPKGDLSPETKAMLNETSEDAPLADSLTPDRNPGASVGLPVASLPVPPEDDAVPVED